MAMTTYDGQLEAWAEHLETLQSNLETLYGGVPITPTLPTVTNHDGMLGAIADEAGKAAWNIAKVYSSTTKVASTTYSVTIPSTALYCAGLVKIGGKTISQDNTLLSAKVTKVVSKDSDGNIVDIFEVPAEVQALTGYGWSAGTAYNYIDLENKKFVQTVGSVVLNGTESWTGQPNSTVATVFTSIADRKIQYGNNISDKYTAINTAAWVSADYGVFSGHPSLSREYFTVPDQSITSAAAFKTWLSENNVTVYFELDAPIETDISENLTKSTIKVVPGGTLTFVNENELDVPSEVEYIAV